VQVASTGEGANLALEDAAQMGVSLRNAFAETRFCRNGLVPRDDGSVCGARTGPEEEGSSRLQMALDDFG
jgi:hypothetical protein